MEFPSESARTRLSIGGVTEVGSSPATQSFPIVSTIEAVILRVISAILAHEDPSPALGLHRGLLSRSPCGDFTGARCFLHTLRALVCSHELLLGGRTASLRELYYLNASLMETQAESNAALARAQAALGGAPRHALGFFSAARGRFAGLLAVAGEGGGWALPPPGGAPVLSEYVAAAPPGGRFRAAGARFLLIVEKEAVFRRLAEDRLWALPGMGCVLVTGCGMPCLATRALVRQVADAHGPGFPVLGLADYNPFGLGILLVYAHGSGSGGGPPPRGGPAAPASSNTVPQLRWLGLRGADLAAHGVPAAALQPLTGVDRARAAGLAACPHVARSAPLAAEAAAWRSDGGGKAEIEALMGNGVGYLAATFLPEKLGVAGAHVATLSERFLDLGRCDALPLGLGAPGEGGVGGEGWEEEDAWAEEEGGAWPY
jgi:meiotic recombination protein SPO11